MQAPEILGTVLLVIGAIIAVSEMHTLTIYLIAVAVACFAGSAAAFAGAGLPISLAVVGVVVLLGLPIAHWVRGRLKNRASDEVSNDDVGRTAKVLETGGETLRVSYRGTAWQARMQDASAAMPQAGQTLRIVAREGNVLVLAATDAA
jgi:membrane protein implicated in regulation of membrane protease activity